MNIANQIHTEEFNPKTLSRIEFLDFCNLLYRTISYQPNTEIEELLKKITEYVKKEYSDIVYHLSQKHSWQEMI